MTGHEVPVIPQRVLQARDHVTQTVQCFCREVAQLDCPRVICHLLENGFRAANYLRIVLSGDTTFRLKKRTADAAVDRLHTRRQLVEAGYLRALRA